MASQEIFRLSIPKDKINLITTLNALGSVGTILNDQSAYVGQTNESYIFQLPIEAAFELMLDSTEISVVRK